MKINARLRSVYQNMLNYIQKRYQSDSTKTPTEVERKFIDILKTIIEGGYAINEKEFYDVLDDICTPTSLTTSEVRFFKTFMQSAKIKMEPNSFTAVFETTE